MSGGSQPPVALVPRDPTPLWAPSFVCAQRPTNIHVIKNNKNNSLGKIFTFFWFFVLVLVFGFLRQGFSVALEPVLELTLVAQTGLELTEICLPLPPKCWD